MPEFGDLIYYEVTSRYRSGPANLFVVEPSAGPGGTARPSDHDLDLR